MSATSRQNCAGFTLIEVLLAVAITATVMLTVGSTFHVMLNARDVVEDLAESTAAGPRILNLIERDLRGLWTYNIKGNAVFKGTLGNSGQGDADRMDFLTTTDSVGVVEDIDGHGHHATICEVGYWLKQNPRFRDVFELWRREDPMVDDDLTTRGTFQLVHDRVKSFKVRYYETLGNEAEELLEWDSSKTDTLPKRIKIEFTIERRRSSRNVVNDVEIEDFEGAQKTYVRHFVLDRRLEQALQANEARIPILPPPPEAETPQGPIGPAGPGGGPAGPGGPGARGDGAVPGGPAARGPGGGRRGGGKGDGAGRAGGGGRGGLPGGGRPGGGPPGGGQVPTQLPPGFNFNQFFGNGGGNLFGGG